MDPDLTYDVNELKGAELIDDHLLVSELMHSNTSTVEFALTTFDNPFDPFDQFDEWFSFDEEKGYRTCQRLARVAKTSSNLSAEEEEKVYLSAIEDMVSYDPFGIYKIVAKRIEKTN